MVVCEGFEDEGAAATMCTLTHTDRTAQSLLSKPTHPAQWWCWAVAAASGAQETTAHQETPAACFEQGVKGARIWHNRVC